MSGSTCEFIWDQQGICGASWEAGPPGTTVSVTLDCSNQRPGSTVEFDMFKNQPLVAPWQIESLTFSQGIALIAPSGTSPRTKIRLATGPNSVITSIIKIMIVPAPPDPLAQCSAARQQDPPDFVCQSDNDCKPGATSVVVAKPQFCSIPCGNRCVTQ